MPFGVENGVEAGAGADCCARVKFARSELVNSRFDFSNVGRRPTSEGPPLIMFL